MTPPASHDPGWGFSPRTFFRVITPGRMQMVAKQQPSSLLQLRQIFMSFILVLVFIAALVVLIIPGAWSNLEPRAQWLWLAATVVVSIVNFVAIMRFHAQLNCADDGALASSYQSRMFLRIALGQAAVLVGFVGSATSGVWWIFFVGAALSVPGFLWAAPSARNISRDQAQLGKGGCTRSIVAVLAGP